MCGGRLRTERLARLVTANRIHPEKLITHTFHGLDSVEPALMLMRNKPRDLIKPLVVMEESKKQRNAGAILNQMTKEKEQSISRWTALL